MHWHPELQNPNEWYTPSNAAWPGEPLDNLAYDDPMPSYLNDRVRPQLSYALRYPDVPLKGNQIRLLKILPRRDPSSGVIECRTTTVELGSWQTRTPAYTALSYQWAPDTLSPAPQSIFLNGELWGNVTENLYDFLKSMDSDSGYLWIDALSIDQRSNEEKNHNVKKMAEIYKRAQQTIIWLGRAQPHLISSLHSL